MHRSYRVCCASSILQLNTFCGTGTSNPRTIHLFPHCNYYISVEQIIKVIYYHKHVILFLVCLCIAFKPDIPLGMLIVIILVTYSAHVCWFCSTCIVSPGVVYWKSPCIGILYYWHIHICFEKKKIHVYVLCRFR